MQSGTKVNELVESLPNGDLIRLVGNGWRPRSHFIELFNDDGKILIAGIENLTFITAALNKFLAKELEMEKDGKL